MRHLVSTHLTRADALARHVKPPAKQGRLRRPGWRTPCALALAALAACGGGGGDIDGAPLAATAAPAPQSKLHTAGVPAAPKPAAAAQPARAPKAAGSAPEAAHTEAGFRAEPLDAAWSNGATAAIQKALEDGTPLANHVDHIECRSRSCRIDVSPEGAELVLANLPELLQRLSGVLPHATILQAGGRDIGAATVVLLSR